MEQDISQVVVSCYPLSVTATGDVVIACFVTVTGAGKHQQWGKLGSPACISLRLQILWSGGAGLELEMEQHIE